MSTEPRVIVYTTDFCSFCVRAKMLLDARRVVFREEHLPATPASRDRLRNLHPTARTFPQIVIDGEVLGGYHELVALDRAGGLTKLAS